MDEHDFLCVSAGAVVSISSGMSESQRDDVVNSVLFAQRVASKKFPGADSSEAWYDLYLEVLRSGWLKTDAAWNSSPPEPHAYWTITQAITLELDKMTSEQTIIRIQRALSVIGQQDDCAPVIQLLRRYIQVPSGEASITSDEESAKVRLLVILADQGPSLTSVVVEFDSAQPILPNPLNQAFASQQVKGDIGLKVYCAELSYVLYDPARDRIISKLGDKVTTEIARLSPLIDVDHSGECSGDV